MTVSSQTPINRSTGNGVTTVFPYTFKIISSADMEVSVDGVVKTLTVDYTLSGVGDDAGGNVTMLAAPATSTSVVRRRNMALTRNTDYQDQGELPASTLDSDLDSAVLMIQQVDEKTDRAMVLPTYVSGFSTELPTPIANYFLRVNSAGTALELASEITPGALTVTPFIETLLNATTPADARTAIGALGASDTTANVNSVRFGKGSGEIAGNIAIGPNAMASTQAYANNIAIGDSAMNMSTGSYHNVFIGNSAGYRAASTAYNIGIGFGALSWGGGIGMSGANNTAIGANGCLSFCSSGNNNTAIGTSAGGGITTGNNNTAIGTGAATGGSKTGSNNVYIGSGADSSSASVSNEVNIYNGSVYARFQGAAAAWSFVSDSRDKDNITDSQLGLTFVNDLTPRRFEWAMRGSDVDIGKPQVGFIAQELQGVVLKHGAQAAQLVDTNDPERFTIAQTNLIPILVKAVQELTARIATLEARP